VSKCKICDKETEELYTILLFGKVCKECYDKVIENARKKR